MTKKLPPIIYDPQYGLVRRVAAQTLATGVLTIIAFDTVVLSNGLVYDAVNNWFVTPETGLYIINGFCSWVASGVGSRQVVFFVNGAVAYGRNPIPSINVAGGNNADLSALADLTAGDTVQMKALQSSGGNLNTAVIGKQPQFAMARVSNS